jgi:steroid delta-isomerase-like uncharacterized protein
MKMDRRLLLAATTSVLLAACSKPAPPVVQAPQDFVATVPAAPPPAAIVPKLPPAETAPARRVLNDWLSAWNAHDTSQAANLLDDNVEYFDAGFAGIQHGRDAAIEKGMGAFLRGVPDLQIELRGEPIVGTDAVAWEWTFTGTNTGTWGGIPATNQHIQLKGFSLMRLRDGRIVALSSYYDTGTLNRQLGL